MKSSLLRLAAAFGLILVALPSAAAEFTETRTISSNTLTLTNLIGEVRVSGHSGSGFEVSVRVQGADATRARVGVEDSRDSLTVAFPDAKKFVYPALSPSSSVRFNPDERSGSWIAALLGGGQVQVSRDGGGLEIWADVEVKVPQGGNLRLRHGVGDIIADDIRGDLDLDTHHGTIRVESVDGELVVDTGSGAVHVAGIEGRLSIDTGSGRVEVDGARGDDVVVDTGSGAVSLLRVTASGNVSVDTGSGDVTLDEVSGEEIYVDTGSGKVEATGIRAGGARIDTGSGRVRLHLAEMGRGDFEIDTGSGGIELGLPAGAGCRVHAESGSGGVSMDLAGATDVRRHEDDEISFTLGGGGASVSLDAGSGKIRIVKAD